MKLFITLTFSLFLLYEEIGAQITLNHKSTIITGDPVEIFDQSAAEIAAYDHHTKRVFITNAYANRIDVVDISDIENPKLINTIDITPYGDSPTSVDVDPRCSKKEIAVAVPNEEKTLPGKVIFFDLEGHFLNEVEVGALPDMLTYTHLGRRLLVANEGEPDDDYLFDPLGSVSIINVNKGAKKVSQDDVTTLDFTDFNDLEEELKKSGVRIFGPGATVAQDLEPEYITVTKNGKKAWVALQENNAIAEIDVRKKEITALFGLGGKNHDLAENPFDASNKDDSINIRNWPVESFYQPDAIANYRHGGRRYLVTANEGDARDYNGYSEEERVKDITLDPIAFPNAADLQQEENLGRLKITTANGDVDNDGDFDTLHGYGGRSFSIWDIEGNLIYDSGDNFEQILANELPNEFNSNNDENDSFDARSDDKGPEPEGIVVGKVGHRKYAFIGLERIGGIMVYDISIPQNPQFVEYVNTRDFQGDPEQGTAGDLGPEGILFIPKWQSPSRKPLLIVTNEVSGTTTIFEIERT